MKTTRKGTIARNKLRLGIEPGPPTSTLIDNFVSRQEDKDLDLNSALYKPEDLQLWPATKPYPYVEHITSEEEPSRAARCNSLRRKRKLLRKLRKAKAKEYFAKSRFEAIVKRNTRIVKRRKKVALRRVWELPKIVQIPIYKEERVTYLEHAKRMRRANVDHPKAYAFWAKQALWYSQHPRYGETPYPVPWRTIIGYKSCPVDGTGGPRWVPVIKRIPYRVRDWQKIRLAWYQTRRTGLDRLYATYDRPIHQLTVKIQALSQKSPSAPFNACDAAKHGIPCEVPMRKIPAPETDQGSLAWLPFWQGVYPPTHTVTDEVFTACHNDSRWWCPNPASIIRQGFNWASKPMLDGLLEREGGPNIPRIGLPITRYVYPLNQSEYTEWRWEQIDGGPWRLLNKDTRERVEDSDLFRTSYDLVTGYRVPDDYPDLPLTIQTSNLEALVEEKRREAFSALRNLDVDAVSQDFNLTRSIGELKDTPGTVRSGAEFLRFIRDLRSGTPYWSYKPNKDSLFRRFCLKKSRVPKTAQGITLEKVKAKTPMGVIASLYLAWKFGIQPTIQDGQTIIRDGWDYTLSVRRSLVRAISHLQAVSDYYVCHVTRGVRDIEGDEFDVKEGLIYKPQNDVVSEAEFQDEFDLEPIAQRINAGDTSALDTIEVDGVKVPVVLGKNYGLAIIDPRIRGGYAYAYAGRIYSNRELLALVDKWNSFAVLNQLRKQDVGSVLRLYQRVRIRLFAKFSRNTVFRSLSRRWSSVFSKTRLAETAWELTPLSFVVDWFVNTRQIVRGMQQSIASTLDKIYPVGRVWESVRSRLWVRKITDVALKGTVSMRALGFGNCYYSVAEITTQKVIIDGEQKECRTADVRSVVYATHVLATFKYAVTTVYNPWVQRTRMLRFVRRPCNGRLGNLPVLRCKVNLNVGKLSSLLAMFISKR